MKAIKLSYIEDNPDRFKVCVKGQINYFKNKKCVDTLCTCNNTFKKEPNAVKKWVQEQYDFLTDGSNDPILKKSFGESKLYDIEN